MSVTGVPPGVSGAVQVATPLLTGNAVPQVKPPLNANDPRGLGLASLFSSTRRICPPTTMVARFGGEEFVVADIYRTDDLHDIAEQLRKAVAATRYPITASIGIVSVPLGPSFDPAERELINDLVNLADTAMYAAKRAGGNQSRYTHISRANLKGSAA